MDYQIPSSSIIFTFLFLAFMVWRIWSKSKNHNNSIKPPGPKKLPLIGNIHQLINPLPYRRLRELAHKYGPLVHLQLGENEMYVISSAEIAEEVMKTQEVMFAQRPTRLTSQVLSYNHTDIISAPYGDYWRELRKICTVHLLSAKCVKSFKSIRGEEATKLVSTISSRAGAVINYSAMLYSLTYSIVSRSAFSTDEEAFVSTVKGLLQEASRFEITDLFPSVKILQAITRARSKLERLHQEFDKITESIIKEHKDIRTRSKADSTKHEDKDIVDILLSLEEQGNLEFPFTNRNIKAILQDVFTAGTDTSSTALEWVMSELIRNPRVMEKAQAEVRQVFGKTGHIDEDEFHQLPYLKLVIKETLRLHTPIPLVLRECRGNCKINGYDIPHKARIVMNVWAMARDPKYWNEPDRFYPERFLDNGRDYKGTNYEFMPFGAGRRMCPAMLFGVTNVELPIVYLLYHFNWELPPGLKPKDLDMTECFGVVAKRKNDLFLVPTPYLTTPSVSQKLYINPTNTTHSFDVSNIHTQVQLLRSTT